VKREMFSNLWFKASLALLLISALDRAPTPQSAAAPASPTDPPMQTERTRYEQAMEERLHNDWAYLSRYREENARLGLPAAGERRVVFMGDSITEGWGGPGSFFPGKPYINRGISGQTTPQMLVRFRPDVIALKPRVVVILAGTNDIAGNTGPTTLEMTRDNLMSMVDLARANGIRVVLASVLPAYDFPWQPGARPAGKIAALNAWLKEYAAQKRIVYLDYYSAMVDDRQGLKAELSPDGVHPNAAGYAVMAPLAEKAIARASGRR
jgi:acyl-CoA thioesterase I